MNICEIQDRILQLKHEKGVYILAHSYQAREIVEIADFSGDSFQLSLAASKAVQDKVIMCGVRFMAETVKILSPEKTVILANPEAGCPMAEQIGKDMVSAIRAQNPESAVIAYINTTAELKTVCDVCVTSSSAVKIVKNIPNENIIFLPDRNLGAYVASQAPNKNIILLQGGCPVHSEIDAEDVKKAKEMHPGALVLTHPECSPDVIGLSDFVGSTSAIMEFAENSENREFIIGTEMRIAEHLQYRCPGKSFYALSHKLLCPDMRITTLMDVYNCLNGDAGEVVSLDEETIAKARVCIDKMIEMEAMV